MKQTVLTPIADWMTLMGQEVRTSPSIPNKQICDLRVSLIQSELNELQAAIAEGNLVEIADALLDLKYVVGGGFADFGMIDIADAMFMEVQHSNMSKFCNTEEEAEQTIVKLIYENNGQDIFDYKQVGQNWVVFRTTDGKVMKGINFIEPNLEAYVIQAQRDALLKDITDEAPMETENGESKIN